MQNEMKLRRIIGIMGVAALLASLSPLSARMTMRCPDGTPCNSEDKVCCCLNKQKLNEAQAKGLSCCSSQAILEQRTGLKLPCVSANSCRCVLSDANQNGTLAGRLPALSEKHQPVATLPSSSLNLPPLPSFTRHHDLQAPLIVAKPSRLSTRAPPLAH